MVRLVDHINSLPIDPTNNMVDISGIKNKKVYDFFHGKFLIFLGIENGKCICIMKSEPNNPLKYSIQRLYLINNETEFEEIKMNNDLVLNN